MKKENLEYHTKPCKDCGKPKEYGYRKSCRCSACTEVLRKTKRSYANKSPHGTRKKTCGKCGELKDGKYDDGYCLACRGKMAKERKARIRIEKGMRPYNSGRKPECCRCGKIKENITYGYCSACDALAKKERRDSKVSSEEGRIKERATYHAKKEAPDFMVKKLARNTLNKYVSIGKVDKLPCEVCGIEKTEAHHDDYTKPLDVRWLCRKHHVEHHKNEKIKKE